MSYNDSAKDNPLNWSFYVGRLFAINIRVHLFFILGAAFLVAMAFKEAKENQALTSVSESLITIAILFLIVLLHEFGHCWGARNSGGEADEILMWPLGGLASVRPENTPKGHFVTTAAGPMVNVIICAACAIILTINHGGIGAVPWNPLKPFMPVDLTADWTSGIQYWGSVVFTLSYVILLFNLIPMYPLDGGRLLHCYLWPKKGYRQATLTATFAGMVGAVILGIAGILTEHTLMIIIAVFGYLTCYHDRKIAKTEMLDDGTSEFGYDFSQGFTSFENPETNQAKQPSYFERRRFAKEEARQKQEQEKQEKLIQRVDEILDKVHKNGIESLTAEEKRILKTETERQRSNHV